MTIKLCIKCNKESRILKGNKCDDCIKLYKYEWYIKNKQRVLDRNKKWKDKNKEKYLKYFSDRYKNNKEKMDFENKQYCISHRKKINSYKRKWHNEKYANDINYKIKVILRARLQCALKGKCKSRSTMKLVGCSINKLISHIQKQFTEGMTWDNHGFGEGKWHIDHIRPCSSFDLTNEQEQLQCFNYKNLQPLWHLENLSKGDKWLPLDK